MCTDPTVEEVRKYRMKHTTRFKGDLAAICEDLKAVQAASGHKIVRLKQKRQKPPAISGRRRIS